ncbi:hypothetical protein SAY87_013632 [Trapa incisa]|uniref:Transmembrane protein n=1 Tax=Trapa incisa TaxID=236973 RepID=A0AAN7QDB5_9MYRT|nr:hypothetical protein SAY87_013632 [Trapa incisa]
MSSEQNGDQQAPNPSASGLKAAVEEQYKRIKENAETYPYVWASYIVVYGGFGLWMTYRWRKLRRTEDRVRALQEKLRKIVEAEQSAKVSSSSTTQMSQGARATDKASYLADKAPK